MVWYHNTDIPQVLHNIKLMTYNIASNLQTDSVGRKKFVAVNPFSKQNERVKSIILKINKSNEKTKK